MVRLLIYHRQLYVLATVTTVTFKPGNCTHRSVCTLCPCASNTLATYTSGSNMVRPIQVFEMENNNNGCAYDIGSVLRNI